MFQSNSKTSSGATFATACAVSIILILVPLAVGLYGDELNENSSREFRVDSYIPELFKDLEWRFDGGFLLSGANSESDYGNDLPDDYLTRYIDNESSRQNFNMGSFIQYRYETIPKFLNIGSSFDLKYLNSSSESNSYRTAQNNSIYNFRANSENDYYEINASPFVEAGLYMLRNLFLSANFILDWHFRESPENQSHSFFYSKTENANQYITEKWTKDDRTDFRDTKRYDLDISILPGWGRTYEGLFAAEAIHLIEDLRNNGLIQKDPSHAQMVNLTELIYQNRQTHMIDFRISDIDAILAISDFLKAEGILVDNPVSHAMIMDTWKYYPNFSRKFGFIIKAGIGVNHIYISEQRDNSYMRIQTGYYYHRDSIEYKQITIDTLQSSRYVQSHGSGTIPYIMVSCEYFKPLNHKWQLDLSSYFKRFFDAEDDNFVRQNGHITTDSNHTFREFYDIHGKAEVLYILNTRTVVELTGILNYGHFKSEHRDEAWFESLEYSYNEWYSSLTLRATYRISIPTRLTFKASYRNGHPTMNALYRIHDYDNSGYSLSANISHFIY
jgi:hypothetical protein